MMKQKQSERLSDSDSVDDPKEYHLGLVLWFIIGMACFAAIVIKTAIDTFP